MHHHHHFILDVFLSWVGYRRIDRVFHTEHEARKWVEREYPWHPFKLTCV